VNYHVDDKSDKQSEGVRVGLTEVGEGIYEIALEGETIHVDAVKTGAAVYSIIEDGKQFEVVVDEQGAHGFDVLVGGRLFHLDAIDERTQLLAGSAQNVAVGKQTVEAEMPGKVVKLNVAVGAEVSEGDGVVIIEAMKMENEILSPIDGVVTEIGVSEGQTVENGDLLFVVDLPAGE